MKACTTETTGNSYQTVEMEGDWSKTEEGFLGHRQANFDLELPRTT